MQKASALLALVDPGQLAWVLLSIPASDGGLHPSVCLRPGSQMESRGAYDCAVWLYPEIYEMDPRQPDCETAFSRMARLTETVYRNPARARSIYAHMLELFPQRRDGAGRPPNPPVRRGDALTTCGPER